MAFNLEYFIAKRLNSAGSGKSSPSRPIIKIAIIAIVLGMVMMLVTVASGVGLQKKIREKVSAFNGHIIISNFDGNNSEETVNPIALDQEFYPDFDAVPEVTHVQAIAAKQGIIRTASTFEGVMVKGVGADYNWNLIEEYLTQGRLPEYTGALNTEILLSNYLANRLGFQLGDKLITYFVNDDGKFKAVRFDVVGIYESGFQEFDEIYLFADIRHIQRVNRWEANEVGAFEVFISDFDELAMVGNKVYENTGSTLNSRTVTQKYYSIFEWIALFDFNIILIIAVMILVAGINMIVALLVLILERTQMIGILKALGSTNWSVRKIFLYNAVYLILTGLFWGNLIGIGILLVQQHYGIIALNPETYYVTQAPVDLNWGYILLLNLGTFLLCMLMLLIPSYIVTRIVPVKSIRFE
ncbi:ABC transporter permease [Croceiramulus getboli]|nr:ABC transporter permease [Flavobacteriaceae bacterium YJPT1-3]